MDPSNAPTEPDHKTILLQLIGSLTLCDHMGDVSEDVARALKAAGLEALEWEDMLELGNRLGEMGVTTLYGTKLGSDVATDVEATVDEP